MAKSNLMIDNSKTRVTMWSFEIDDETGQHIHEYDYVIVPMLDGALKIVDKDGSVSISNLKKGECYFCLLYTSPSPRDALPSGMPSSA